jgi:hypothetical protein
MVAPLKTNGVGADIQGEYRIGRNLTACAAFCALAVSLSACASSAHSGADQSGTSGAASLQRECPKNGLHPLPGGNLDASEVLVPPHAVQARLCRYRQRPPEIKGKLPTTVTEASIESPPELHRLEALLGVLPPVEGGAVACESGVPLEFLIGFKYRNEPPVVVRVSYQACGSVTNGASDETYEAPEALRRALNGFLR